MTLQENNASDQDERTVRLSVRLSHCGMKRVWGFRAKPNPNRATIGAPGEGDERTLYCTILSEHVRRTRFVSRPTLPNSKPRNEPQCPSPKLESWRKKWTLTLRSDKKPHLSVKLLSCTESGLTSRSCEVVQDNVPGDNCIPERTRRENSTPQ